MRKTILILVLLLATILIIRVNYSDSYFTDSTQSVGNSFTAGTWEAAPLEEPVEQ